VILKKRIYWNKNNNKVNLKRKERYNLKKQEIQTYQDSWKRNNQYNYEINKKLKDLREQQRQLTIQLCKKQTYKLYTPEIQKVLPTYLLSDLLLLT